MTSGTTDSTKRPRRLVWFVGEDWFFYSHFLARAVAAKEAGWQVSVVTRVSDHGREIEDAGLELIPIETHRASLNPFTNFVLLWRLVATYRWLKPDLVHHVALKPIMFGTLAAKLTGVPAIVNAPVGMGFVFSSNRIKARLLRPLVEIALRGTLNPKNSRVIFENSDDLQRLAGRGFVQRENALLIPGAGVDTEVYAPAVTEPPPPITVTLVSRMLWEKGVGIFVEAARELKRRGAGLRMVVVGAPDTGNMAAISESQLQAWHDAGDIEWLGRREDVPELLRQSHIACLPSFYGEGLPKSLLEAMAAGLPIVTTDVPGCREAVEDGVSGLIVAPRNASELAGALERLATDPDLRSSLGVAARRRALDNYSDAQVIASTLAVYEDMVRAVH